ncbi:GNAT family N-acetyltransferase [Candidatus Leptofilum sp.]|uniref:GNAT family N-acetyltransferase n=1 Tax=Candidatus Leptofilum sp. TaxID=3241576 RepID=UPI003B5CAF92
MSSLIFPKLETERLILREYRLDKADQAALFRIFSDGRVTRYYNHKTFTNPEEARRLLVKRYDRFWQGRGVRWAIVPKGQDELIGSCGFNELNHRTKVGELGYELARPYWQHGIMTEAISAIIAFGLENLSLERIEAWVMPQNRASANLLLKLGFQSEGILERKGYWNGRFHDLELFSLLAEQWNL